MGNEYKPYSMKGHHHKGIKQSQAGYYNENNIKDDNTSPSDPQDPSSLKFIDKKVATRTTKKVATPTYRKAWNDMSEEQKAKHGSFEAFKKAAIKHNNQNE